MPTALAGRDQQREDFAALLQRLNLGYSEKSMILTGLRGVGKTVLLNDFAQTAVEAKWRVIELEIPRAGDDLWFRRQIAIGARRALLSMSAPERRREKLKAALAVLRNFSVSIDPEGKITAGFGVEAVHGLGDSHDLGHDLTDLFVTLGQAAQEEQTGVVFLIDEIQFLSTGQLEALVMALHKAVQKRLPVTLVGAGLPQVAKLSGDAKSYSERLFQFPIIGALNPKDAAIAITEPALKEKVIFTDQAVKKCIEVTSGYPYFIQEIGYAIWRTAAGTSIKDVDVDNALIDYTARLDESFFRVRLDRSSLLERSYMRAMAELGPDPHSAGDVAKLLGRNTNQAATIRKGLIEKGLLYSTPDYGFAQFTVPQFDQYMKRIMPSLTVPPVRGTK